MDYLIHPLVTRHYPGRVSPFGDLRIKAYLRLPEAFRSLSRPSSAISALASTLRSSSLDLACFLLLPKTYCFRSLMEEGSHCVYLGYIVAVSLPLRNLDWILTFSSFRFIFPVQFSRCDLGLISTSWSFGYGPAGSDSRLSSRPSRASPSLEIRLAADLSFSAR